MPQHLTLSRAARLAEVTRAELQRRIRHGDIETFEGEVIISDLLRVFPQVRLDRDKGFERAEAIKDCRHPTRSAGRRRAAQPPGAGLAPAHPGGGPDPEGLRTGRHRATCSTALTRRLAAIAEGPGRCCDPRRGARGR